MSEFDVTWVDSDAALASMMAELRGVDRIGLDTESDGFFRYRARLCLLQVCAGTRVFLVDPLALADLAPLGAWLSEDKHEVIVHDSEGDVFLMAERGLRMARLFDTAVAARLLGSPELGLAALARRIAGVELDKSEQRADWGRRPLTASQTRYAAADVLHLGAVRDALAADLEARGRMAWAHQEFQRAATRVRATAPLDPEPWRKVKGARDLDVVARGRFRDLHAWRETTARRLDVAPFRVANDQLLLALAATHDPATPLPRRGFHPSVFAGDGPAEVLAVLAGAAPDAEKWPEPRAWTQEEREADERFERIRKWRSERARELGMEPGTLVSNAALKALASRVPTTQDALVASGALLPWQVEVLGAGLLQQLAAGR